MKREIYRSLTWKKTDFWITCAVSLMVGFQGFIFSTFIPIVFALGMITSSFITTVDFKIGTNKTYKD